MLDSRKLIVDTFCEVHDLLQPWTDQEFWNFQEHDVIPGACYVFGREQFRLNVDQIKNLAQQQTIGVVLSNPAEGSETLANHCAMYGVEHLIKSKKILLIGGGDMDDSWPYLQYESFLPKILDYKENLEAVAEYQQRFSTSRPYKFLLLNGRYRWHRAELLQRLQLVLPQGLWTNLDSRTGPIQILEAQYEPGIFANTTVEDSGFVKHQRFNNLWGEIYLKAEPYLDTYFSVVTETVFDYPHSFRTEKIWKPMAIGHPWIAVANRGYYKDMHNLGFKTFAHVIDESFDQIENNQDRLHRIADVVIDLCQQDLASFVKECYNVCKYNQQHLAQMRDQVRQEFPERFFHFIRAHHFNE